MNQATLTSKPMKTVVNIPLVSKSKINILFVSSLNICRSLMAEFIMKYLINCQGFSNRVSISSSGINVDPEMSMNQGTIRELNRHQIPFIKKNAVKFEQSDFENYDYIICMSHDQIRYLSKNGRHNNLYLLLNFEGLQRNINNPLPNGSYPFTYSIIYKGCEAILSHLKKCLIDDVNSYNNSKPLTKTNLSVQINEELFKRFESALVLTRDNLDTAVEKSMNYYISEAAKILIGTKNTNKDNKNSQTQNEVISNEEKAGVIENFIKKWAKGIGQINQIIIKSYFKAIELYGKASPDQMKILCNDKNQYPSLYIYKPNGFENYYRQMKSALVKDGHIKNGKSIDGKVFWEDEGEVKILSEVEPVLNKYKSYFIVKDRINQ